MREGGKTGSIAGGRREGSVEVARRGRVTVRAAEAERQAREHRPRRGGSPERVQRSGEGGYQRAVSGNPSRKKLKADGGENGRGWGGMWTVCACCAGWSSWACPSLLGQLGLTPGRSPPEVRSWGLGPTSRPLSDRRGKPPGPAAFSSPLVARPARASPAFMLRQAGRNQSACSTP